MNLSAALAALSLNACAPAPLPEAQRTAIAGEVTQRVSAFVRQLRAPVVDSVMPFYDSAMAFGRAGVWRFVAAHASAPVVQWTHESETAAPPR